MQIEKLTAESFKDFGQVLTMAQVPKVTDDKEFDWYDTAGGIELNEKCCTGMLVCRPRPKKVVKMECHTKTSEVLVALNGDTVFAAAPAGDSLENNDNVKAFLLRQGTSVVMKTATWHWIPFPMAEEDARIMVLFRDGTGADDLNFKDLCCAVSIEDV
ncbi:MAG: ureidoglycolate lyase [Spirochaetales bacterium]|uniref:Ureidoglycolate lyase n=1 Tax=Candidatus Thalassospirochaeta sargassi TaxID=3119039 RepID=A0AAJ1IGY6_9SPIO|nr:ureidoglycolate lyase [Spirochaetales bacterium]